MESNKLTSSCCVTVTRQGLGEYIFSLPESDFQRLLGTRYIFDICWEAATCVVRYSILAFYWRLFDTDRRHFRIIIWAFTALETCWGLAVVCSPLTVLRDLFCRHAIYGFLMIFQVLMTTLRCVSIISLWDETDIGRCSIFAFPLSMGSSILHIFIDVLLLSFPISLIWRLNTYRSHRSILTGLLASGILYVEFLFISPPRSMSKKTNLK